MSQNIDAQKQEKGPIEPASPGIFPPQKYGNQMTYPVTSQPTHFVQNYSNQYAYSQPYGQAQPPLFNDQYSGQKPEGPGFPQITTQQTQFTNQMPINNYPNFVPRPLPISGVPAGLEYLTQLDQVLIKQKIELLEALTSWETSNKYEILNSMGQPFMKATEKSNFCCKQFCGPGRSFEINITDTSEDQQILQISRPFQCCNLVCCPCNKYEMSIKSINMQDLVNKETLLGTVEENWSCFPSYTIRDSNNNKIFNIDGPFRLFHCCQDINFEVSDPAGNKVGNIQKQFRGITEAFVDADNFGVTFPLDLDVRMKAVLIGAVFMIDFMYFESSQDNQPNYLATGMGL